jgi:hypothetical protein
MSMADDDKAKSLADELWAKAQQAGVPIDIGRTVICDSCSEDYTDSISQGGFIFGSRAICPLCASKWMTGIIQNNEQRYIKAAARAGQAFADFVREYRGPNNSIYVGPLRTGH